MSKLKLKNSEGNYTHLVDGAPVLSKQQMHFGIIGATLLDKLGGYIPEKSEYEQIIIYAPKREIKMNFGSNPFNSQWLPISGRMNYNREVNAEKLVVPLSLGADLLGYDTDLTAVFVAIAPAFSAEEIKQHLSKVLGPDFKINTRYEKNELIFKTSKSEKLMVIIILLFIFVLAAFNLVASLTMLFIEKKDNVSTMISFGADRHFVFRIFLTEGLLICAKGIFFGLLLGYFICAIQRYGTPIEMPNTGGEPFPIVCSWKDGLIILMLVSVLSFIFSFWPVKYLIKRNFGNLKY